MAPDLLAVVLVATTGGFFSLVTTVLLILQHNMHMKVLAHHANITHAILEQPAQALPYPTWPLNPPSTPSYAQPQTLPQSSTRNLTWR